MTDNHDEVLRLGAGPGFNVDDDDAINDDDDDNNNNDDNDDEDIFLRLGAGSVLGDAERK